MSLGLISAAGEPVAILRNVSHRYGTQVALRGVSIELHAGGMVGLIGPDGVGKSTLLAILAGAKRVQAGPPGMSEVRVFGGNFTRAAHRRAVCARIAYMPPGLGRNLYPDLTVQDNIAFFSRLFGQGAEERARRTTDLLVATNLAPFADRAARKLSGGMRQKLGLCCALIHDPDLLIHALPRRLHVAAILALHRTHRTAEFGPARAALRYRAREGGPRIASLVATFGLTDRLDSLAADLPLGIRQRLALAVAVINEPQILISDEPTSGVDPLAHDQFWALPGDLSRKDGVTIFISTHFMNEAAWCDHILLMRAGEVLALGTPAEVVCRWGGPTLEEPSSPAWRPLAARKAFRPLRPTR